MGKTAVDMFIIRIIKWELRRINWLIEKIRKKLEMFIDLPNITLVAKRKGTNLYYYAQEYKDKSMKQYYLGTPEDNIVKRLKVRRFYQNMLKALQKDKELLTRVVRDFIDYSAYEIHKHLPNAYKNLPEECFEDETLQKMKEWASQKYERNTFPIPDQPNIARDGTAMRSKGECMWYDDILFEDVPVRIDPTLHLTGKSGRTYTMCPDFQFICPDGSFLLVEHFGKLDDDNYAAEKMRRIQQYLDCGYVLGDNLIVTSDTINHTTNELMILEALDKIKKRVLGR